MRAIKSEDLGFIHNFIPNHNNDGKVLLLLHGTGGNEDDLLTIAQMMDEGATILAPRGKVLENGMPRYFRRLAEGIFDVEDVKFRTNELADFVKETSVKYAFDPRSVVAVGYSNGANIAASMLIMRPESVKNAVLFRAMIPIVPDKLPDLTNKKVFISAGRFDSMIPQSKTIELKEYLERAGAKVKLNLEDSTHSLTTREIEKARLWLRDSEC